MNNEIWRKAWRAFSKIAPTDGLERLRDRLKADDARLLQGATTMPPPILAVADWPCEGACPVGTLWMTEGATVGQVEEEFARHCAEADKILGEAAGGRWFLNWWDETPRQGARRELLAEVEGDLAARAAGGEA